MGKLYYKYLMANHLKPPQGDKATVILNKIKGAAPHALVGALITHNPLADATGLTDPYGLAWATSIFFKPKTGVPRFSDTFDQFLQSREDAQTARALVVVMEVIKQMLRLQTGFAVFVDDYYSN